MAVSGRAGLFTINQFNPNLTDDVHTTIRGQKSGALRLEFGKVNVTNATITMASVQTTINTGIMTVISPTHARPNPPVLAYDVSGQISTHSGAFGLFCSGSFRSGAFGISITQTGSYSGWCSGMDINYMVVGY